MNIILCETPFDEKLYESILCQENGQLFLDLEGVQLGKEGKICLLQFTQGNGDDRIFVLDIIKSPELLGKLGKVLESQHWRKYIFDPRGDSSNLFHEFGITMRNVVCLQLAEIAFDRQNGIRRNFVSGLSNVLKRVLDTEQQIVVCQMKDEGKRMFSPDKGGSFEIFEKRPLPEKIIEYSAMDVFFLEDIKRFFFDVLDQYWVDWVLLRSFERLELACSSSSLPTGKKACIAPL